VHRRGGPGLLTIIYLVVGIFVAGDHNYIHHHTIGQIVCPLGDRALAADPALRRQSAHPLTVG